MKTAKRDYLKAVNICGKKRSALFKVVINDVSYYIYIRHPFLFISLHYKKIILIMIILTCIIPNDFVSHKKCSAYLHETCFISNICVYITMYVNIQMSLIILKCMGYRYNIDI